MLLTEDAERLRFNYPNLTGKIGMYGIAHKLNIVVWLQQGH